MCGLKTNRDSQNRNQPVLSWNGVRSLLLAEIHDSTSSGRGPYSHGGGKQVVGGAPWAKITLQIDKKSTLFVALPLDDLHNAVRNFWVPCWCCEQQWLSSNQHEQFEPISHFARPTTSKRQIYVKANSTRSMRIQPIPKSRFPYG